MLKILYLTFIAGLNFLLWVCAHANEMNDMHGWVGLESRVENLVEKLNDLPQGPQPIQCGLKDELFELANQCAKSICGEPKDNRSIIFDQYHLSITNTLYNKLSQKQQAEVESIISNEFTYSKGLVEQVLKAQKSGQIDADPKQVKADLEAFTKLANDNGLKDNLLNDCLRMHEVDSSFLIKIEKFKKDLDNFREIFLQRNPIALDSKSKSFLEKFFKDDLKYDFGIDDRVNLLQRFKDFDQRQKPVSPADQYKYIRESVSKKTLSGLNSLCSQGFFLHTDMMSYEQSKINISHFNSSFYLPTNSFIFAHEMAHAFSGAIRNGHLSEEAKNLFLSKMKCIDANNLVQQKVPSSTIPLLEEETYFSEEDMADFIAARVLEKGAKSYCAILAYDFERKNYDYLDLSSSETPKLNSLNHYLHSSSFTRLLRMAIYRKEKLSPSCQKIIHMTKDQFRWNSCD